MKIKHFSALPWLGVSHNPDIKKKTFVEKGEIPNLMMFGTATFLPGQSVGPHAHETMHEVFYIQRGSAVFKVSDEEYVLSAGDCITIAPKEVHAQHNPFDEEVVWLYFGIAEA
ncbi:MAG: cupin domain-containing protein [Flavobacteriaceae bacterium]